MFFLPNHKYQSLLPNHFSLTDKPLPAYRQTSFWSPTNLVPGFKTLPVAELSSRPPAHRQTSIWSPTNLFLVTDKPLFSHRKTSFQSPPDWRLRPLGHHFRWFSNDCPIIFIWFPRYCQWLSDKCPMIVQWISYDFQRCPTDFPMVVQCFSYQTISTNHYCQTIFRSPTNLFPLTDKPLSGHRQTSFPASKRCPWQSSARDLPLTDKPLSGHRQTSFWSPTNLFSVTEKPLSSHRPIEGSAHWGTISDDFPMIVQSFSYDFQDIANDFLINVQWLSNEFHMISKDVLLIFRWSSNVFPTKP